MGPEGGLSLEKLVGQHQETGLFYCLRHSLWPKRAASAGLMAGLVLVAYGSQSPVVTAAPGQGSPAGQGSVAPRSLSNAVTTPAAGADVAAAPAPVAVDPAALVSFERSTVQTVAKDGSHRLAFASLGLQRPKAGTLRAPLEFLTPSSSFGHRINPLTGEAGEFHWGQDFAAKCGTRVYAADSGTVRAVGWHPWGGGNRVEIDHGNGLITTYNHLESIAVKQGASVEVGEVIAKVGTTGMSTGCHLHFETILNGVHTNPSNWTFLATVQQDRLGDLAMHNYAPGIGTSSASATNWAVPMTVGHVHTDDHVHYEFREHLSPTQHSAGTGSSTTAPVAPTVTTPPAPSVPVPPTAPTETAPTDSPSDSETSTPDPVPDPVVSEPTESPEPSSTPEPTVSAEPTTEPEPTVSAEPTTEPEPTVSAEPTAAPDAPVSETQTLSPAPAVEPVPVVAQAPAAEPAPAPAPAPAPVPAPAPAPAPAPVPAPAPAVAPDPVAPAAPTAPATSEPLAETVPAKEPATDEETTP